MDVHFLQMKCFFIIHIACLHIPSAESRWTSILHPLSADAGRQTATNNEYSFDTGATQGADRSSSHGGFGGFGRRKNVKRGRVRQFGQFNSDTHSCSGIQTKSCSCSSDCTGCLGLFTCNLNLGKCQLKGLSQQTDKFLQSLRDF